jgi:hypothetical protein
MRGSSAALGRVAVAIAGVLVAGLVAASATVAGASLLGRSSTGEGAGGIGRDADLGGAEPVASPPPSSSPEPTSTSAAPAPPAPPDPAPAPPRAPRRAHVAGAAGAGAPKERTVKAPPPRPNRASDAPTQGPSASPAPAATAPGAAPTTARYGEDFPDPFVFRSGAFWYAVSTQRGWSKVPLLRSPDLVHWEERGDALTALPRWSRFGALWAPSVLAVDGGFVLFYTTTEEATGLQCLSSAFSVLPDGPYVDASTEPLVCQRDRGGSIDPSPFRDREGRPWLAWKSEGTTDGEPTRLWSQPLAADGRALAADGSGPAELLATALPWEGPIIEAPSMFVADDGTYHLLYSGNRWETSSYGIGHARCAGPAGPCVRSTDGPVGSGHASEAGAGGAEVFRDPADGRLRAAYHAWDPSAVGYPGGLRRLRIGDVRLDKDGAMRVEPLPR